MILPVTRARASAPAGVVISNQAHATFTAPGGIDTLFSNAVATPVLAVFSLRLTPAGTPATPAFMLQGLPGDTLVCRFQLDNLGNARDSVTTSVTTLPPSSLAIADAIVFLDANANGRVDAGEDDPAFLALAAETFTPLDLAVVLPAAGTGSALVELRTTSAVDPGRARRAAAVAPVTDAVVIRVTSVAALADLHAGPAGNPRATPGGEGSADDVTTVVLGPLDDQAVFDNDVLNLSAAPDVIEIHPANAAIPAGASVACMDTNGVALPASATPGGFALGTLAPGESRRVRTVVSSPGTPLRLVLGTDVSLVLTARSAVDTLAVNATTDRIVLPVLPDPRAMIGLEQTFREATAALGDVVTLVVTATNRTDSIRVDNVRVRESLPPALDFLEGAGVSVAGGGLTWNAGALAPGESRTVAIKFAVNARESKGHARVSGTAEGDAETGDRVTAGPVLAAIRIDNEEWGIDGFVLGDVWIDADADGVREEGEAGVAGVSVYLESGEYAVTDSAGVFSIPHVFEGRRVVRLDERSLPAQVTFAEPLSADTDAPRANERLVHLIAPGHVRVAFPVRATAPAPVGRTARVAVAERVSVAPRARPQRLTLSSSYFAFGRAELLRDAQNELVPVADFLKDNPGWTALVEGHTDNVPMKSRTYASNQVLSEARAGSVRDALARLGVSSERFIVRGYADARPIASNTTVDGRSLNRRVEVSFIPPGHEGSDPEKRIAAAVRDLSALPDSVQATVFWSLTTTADRTQSGSLRMDVPSAFAHARVVASQRGDTLASAGGAFVFERFARGVPIDCRVTFTASAADTHAIRDIVATLALVDSAQAGQGARTIVLRPLSRDASLTTTVAFDAATWTEHVTPGPALVPARPPVAPATPDARAMAILEPLDGAVTSDRDQVTVRVRHPLGSRVTLSVNGDAVGEEQVGQRTVDVANDVQTTTWYGVHVRAGWNDVHADAVLLTGGSTRDSVRVALASRPAEIVPLDARPVLAADGRASAALRFGVRDAFGLPVMDGFVVTVTEGADWVAVADARPGERGVQAATREGLVTLAVKPRRATGTVTVAVEADGMRAATEVVFVAPERPFLATGVVDVAMGVTDARGEGSGSGLDGFQDGFDVDAQARLFAQGAAPGGIGVTARIDTRKRYDDPLLKQPDPEKQYPVFGDASELHYAAPARGGNYVSLDRGQSYLRYGDFKTPIDRGEFLTYHQTVTGLTTALVDGPNSVRAFVTETDFVTRTDDLPADGTSGFYYLTASPIVENSERVILETRDRFQSEVVLEARVMMRRRDYTVNPYDGSLLFFEPVPVTDRELNPNRIVVTYEVESGDADVFLAGLRGDVVEGRRYRAGATVIANGGDGPRYALFGADGELRWRGLRAGGEVARSDDDLAGHGDAYKIAAGAARGASALDLYLRRVDGDFSNPSFRGADSELASVKAGFDGRLALTPGLTARADGYTHELMRTDERRETVRATIDYRRRLLEMSAGLRVAHHDEPSDVSPSVREDARGVLALAGVTVGARGSFGVSTSLEQNIGGEIVDDYPNRLKTVLAVPLSERFRAIATHEYLTARGLPSTHQVTAGVEGTAQNGLQAYSRYAMDRAASDARMGAVSGLRQRLMLRPRLSATVGVEGFTSLSGREDDEYLSLTGGVSAKEPGSHFVEGGYEYRHERLGDKHLLRLNAAQQLDHGLAWLTKNIVGLGNRDDRDDETQVYTTLAGAYRSPHAPVQSLLAIKSYYDRFAPVDPEAIRWRLVTSVDVNAMPSPAHELRFKYAYKRVEDWSYSVSRTTNTDLVLGQYVWHFGRGWDVDVWGRMTAIRGGGTAGFGAGVEVGRLVFRSVRVGLGYGINGFEDADVTGTDAWSAGFGLRIQMILSDWLLADFERLR